MEVIKNIEKSEVEIYDNKMHLQYMSNQKALIHDIWMDLTSDEQKLYE